jgi:hypothetical protein
MCINFFCNKCQELPINNPLFGLCDDQNGTKAYTNIDNPAKWIATVKNDYHVNLVFTAIDKCVIKDNEEAERGRCDGMLTSEGKNHIYFVELKDEAKNWITNAIEQLESTIRFFIENHDITVFKHKKAFACNKQHSRFQVIDNEFNLRFFRKYGVRIDIQTEVIIV